MIKSASKEAEEKADDLNPAVFGGTEGMSITRQARRRQGDAPATVTPAAVVAPAPTPVPAPTPSPAAPPLHSSGTVEQRNGPAEATDYENDGKLEEGAEELIEQIASRRRTPISKSRPGVREKRLDLNCTITQHERLDDLARHFNRRMGCAKIKLSDLTRAIIEVVDQAEPLIRQQLQGYLEERPDAIMGKIDNSDHDRIRLLNHHMAVVISRALREAATIQPPPRPQKKRLPTE